ncbi:MAG: phage integrase N-terminal SAM-like domain-containing protein [Acidimicrobiia bacterium]
MLCRTELQPPVYVPLPGVLPRGGSSGHCIAVAQRYVYQADTRGIIDAVEVLAERWELHLRAERKADQTVQVYMSAVARLDEILEAAGMPRGVSAITREPVEAFIVHLIDTGSPATAVNRYNGLQQFFSWLTEEGEIADSPMARMSPRSSMRRKSR